MKKIIAIILFSLALLLLISLGIWQTNRGLHKAHLLSLIDTELKDEQQIDRIPMDFSHLEYGIAQLTGKWINNRDFLLANRVYKNQLGYEVLSLFQLDSGQLLLVNRGWIAKQQQLTYSPPDRATLPKGTLYQPQKGYTIGHAVTESDSWPKISLYLDTEAFSLSLAQSVSPLLLVLDPEDKNSFTRIWKAVIMTPERHYGYAIQWFALAFVLLIFGFIWRKHSNT